MIPASSQPERASIGLSTIWGEGQDGHRVSLLSFTRHIIRRALGNLRRSPLTVALSVVTISVALALLSAFSLVLHNCSVAVAKEGGELQVMVFLKDTATKAEIDRLSGRMVELMPGGKVSFTDKTAALKRFRSTLGDDATMLEGLEQDNPLPASLDMQPVSPEQAERLYKEISARFAQEPIVEAVRYSQGGVQQLKKIISLVRGVGLVGVVFLLVITGFIIANTIKLALYGHRMEIEIMQLVGARNFAICAPYVIEGLIQGVLGAFVALGATFVAFLVLRSTLMQTEVLKYVFPSVEFLPAGDLGLIVGAGAVVGMAGSYLAVRRFLAEG